MTGKWCCWRGLNSRPLPYQGSALPLSYNSIGPGGRSAESLAFFGKRKADRRRGGFRSRSARKLPHAPFICNPVKALRRRSMASIGGRSDRAVDGRPVSPLNPLRKGAACPHRKPVRHDKDIQDQYGPPRSGRERYRPGEPGPERQGKAGEARRGPSGKPEEAQGPIPRPQGRGRVADRAARRRTRRERSRARNGPDLPPRCHSSDILRPYWSGTC